MNILSSIDISLFSKQNTIFKPGPNLSDVQLNPDFNFDCTTQPLSLHS